MRKWTPTINYCFEESLEGFPFKKSATMFTKTLLPRFWGTFPKEGAGWSFPWQGFCLAPLRFSLISITTTTCLSFSLLYCGVLNIGDGCAAISVMFHLYSNRFQLVALKLWLHDFRIFFFDYFLSLCNKNYYSFFSNVSNTFPHTLLLLSYTVDYEWWKNKSIY